MSSSHIHVFTDVKSAICFGCNQKWFGRVAKLAAEKHAYETRHLVVVEVLTRTTFNPEAMGPEAAALVEEGQF